LRSPNTILRGAQLVLLGLSLLFLPVEPEPAQANDASLAHQLAELAFSEETFIAISIASIDEIRQEMRSRLAQFADISSLSDRDLDVMVRVFSDINAKGMAAGMRRALERKLEDLPEKDLEIMLACTKNFVCKREDISRETLSFIKEMPAFGRSKGEEIGRAVGEATHAKVIEKLKSMDESEFDNRDELIRIMSLPAFRT
jgi:hypothetical protein